MSVCSVQTQNPLFKGATTTVYNPLHDEDENEKEHSEAVFI